MGQMFSGGCLWPQIVLLGEFMSRANKSGSLTSSLRFGVLVRLGKFIENL